MFNDLKNRFDLVTLAPSEPLATQNVVNDHLHPEPVRNAEMVPVLDPLDSQSGEFWHEEIADQLLNSIKVECVKSPSKPSINESTSQRKNHETEAIQKHDTLTGSGHSESCSGQDKPTSTSMSVTYFYYDYYNGFISFEVSNDGSRHAELACERCNYKSVILGRSMAVTAPTASQLDVGILTRTTNSPAKPLSVFLSAQIILLSCVWGLMDEVTSASKLFLLPFGWHAADFCLYTMKLAEQSALRIPGFLDPLGVVPRGMMVIKLIQLLGMMAVGIIPACLPGLCFPLHQRTEHGRSLGMSQAILKRLAMAKDCVSESSMSSSLAMSNKKKRQRRPWIETQNDHLYDFHRIIGFNRHILGAYGVWNRLFWNLERPLNSHCRDSGFVSNSSRSYRLAYERIAMTRGTAPLHGVESFLELFTRIDNLAFQVPASRFSTLNSENLRRPLDSLSDTHNFDSSLLMTTLAPSSSWASQLQNNECFYDLRVSDHALDWTKADPVPNKMDFNSMNGEESRSRFDGASILPNGSRIKKRQRIKPEEAIYECKVCSKLFKRSSTRKSHMETYKPERTYPHPCTAIIDNQLCSKNCRRKTDLDSYYAAIQLTGPTIGAIYAVIASLKETLSEIQNREDGCPNRFELSFTDIVTPGPLWPLPNYQSQPRNHSGSMGGSRPPPSSMLLASAQPPQWEVFPFISLDAIVDTNISNPTTISALPRLQISHEILAYGQHNRKPILHRRTQITSSSGIRPSYETKRLRFHTYKTAVHPSCI